MENESQSKHLQEKKKNNISSIVILITVVLVVIGIVVYTFLSKNSNNEAKTTTALITSATEKTTESTKKTTKPTEKKTTTTKSVTLNGVTDFELNHCLVAFRDGGGFEGIIVRYNCDDDCDGYEVKQIFSRYQTDEYETIKYLPGTATGFYFGTQNEMPDVQIRSYTGDPKTDNVVYSEWKEVVNKKLIILHDPEPFQLYNEEWEEAVKDCFDVSW